MANKTITSPTVNNILRASGMDPTNPIQMNAFLKALDEKGINPDSLFSALEGSTTSADLVNDPEESGHDSLNRIAKAFRAEVIADNKVTPRQKTQEEQTGHEVLTDFMKEFRRSV